MTSRNPFNSIRGFEKLGIRLPKTRTVSVTDVVVRVPKNAIRNQKHFERTLGKLGLVGTRFIDKQERLCFVVRSKSAVRDRLAFADSIRFQHRAKLAGMAVTACYA